MLSKSLALCTMCACLAACAGPRPIVETLPQPDVPEPYPPMLSQPDTSTRHFGFAPDKAVTELEQAVVEFNRRSAAHRDTSRHGSPMSAQALQGWSDFLTAVDRFLSQGVSATESAVVIATRATIEHALEADAAKYAQVPPELVQDVLARETEIGLRAVRVAKAGARRQRPSDEPPPKRRDVEPREAGGILALGWPIRPAVVNSLFGRRFHPISRVYKEHHGVDLHASLGQPVYAAAAGRVSSAGWNGGYGIVVTIEHSRGVATRYGHLSRATVHEGASVRRGQQIGRAGQTGDATGPHLHFEYWMSGVPTDPLDVLDLPAPRPSIAAR